jgi:type I restriction enzyme M protein
LLSPAIRSKVDALWDKFWSGGIANPLTAIEQISYLLFMRRLDAMDREEQGRAEFVSHEHASLFAGRFTGLDNMRIDKNDLRWSQFRHLPAEEMLRVVRDRVFPFIKTLGGDEHPFARAMQDAVFILPKASLLVEATGIIDEIYTEIERERSEGQAFQDTQGDLYEYLLAEIATSGKNGQFRTPRHIIQMMCCLVDPKLGDRICDPACGTGGFLLGAYQHIVTAYTSKQHREVNENGLERGLIGDRLSNADLWRTLREDTLYGYDFDTTMVRIGAMNLLLHGIARPNLDYADTLSKRFTQKAMYNVVLANPPFKGSIDKGDIHEELSLKTTKTELLFVNRMMNLLDVGGRAGVIVPDGVLFGSSNAHKALRKMLLEECELQAVVSMPSGVFKPYAGVSTAVLVFVKGGKTERVWFYDMLADGYSLDDKREKIEANDIPDVVTQWKAWDHGKEATRAEFEDRKTKAFYVPIEEIVENGYDLSLNRYKEIEYEEVVYDSPKVILQQLRDHEDEIRKNLDELERMLG